MSTVLEAFKPIAEIANSYEGTIVTMSAEAFRDFPLATVGDVAGLFKKSSAVDLVFAGYICSKASNANGEHLTYGEIKSYLDAVKQFRSQITIHTSSVMMIAELITWDAQVVEPVPVLDRQLSTTKNCLVKALDETVTKDPAKVASDLQAILELLPRLVAKLGIDSQTLVSA
jgi:hypothetical protein